MLPVPTIADLATFTGRPEDSFTPFADQALTQATLLFSWVVGVFDPYTDPNEAQLSGNAILEMADRLYLEQPYAAVKATPFNSETIGSYSYGKGTVVAKAKDGQPTGLLWWDLAVQQLMSADRVLTGTGSIDTNTGGVYRDGEGNRFVLGPHELDLGPQPGYDINAELNPRPRLG